MTDKLPALPIPEHRGPDGTGSYFDSFTAAQMHAYGHQCRAEALERAAMVCAAYGTTQGNYLAAAIRALNKTGEA